MGLTLGSGRFRCTDGADSVDVTALHTAETDRDRSGGTADA
ncbi:hypothetical protein ACFR97_11230 [Haloplanus litoreus]|uniref:Uncharacterized protein n=1 Tax=Haloplanus litoreus TaxID=767515 RepID=A0ABD5ZXG7_9EURY